MSTVAHLMDVSLFIQTDHRLTTSNFSHTHTHTTSKLSKPTAVYLEANRCSSEQPWVSAKSWMPRQLAGWSCLVRKSQHTSTTSVSSRWWAVDSTTSTVSSWSSSVPVNWWVVNRLWMKICFEVYGEPVCKCWMIRVHLLICIHHSNLYLYQENNYSGKLSWGIKMDNCQNTECLSLNVCNNILFLYLSSTLG